MLTAVHYKALIVDTPSLPTLPKLAVTASHFIDLIVSRFHQNLTPSNTVRIHRKDKQSHFDDFTIPGLPPTPTPNYSGWGEDTKYVTPLV